MSTFDINQLGTNATATPTNWKKVQTTNETPGTSTEHATENTEETPRIEVSNADKEQQAEPVPEELEYKINIEKCEFGKPPEIISTTVVKMSGDNIEKMIPIAYPIEKIEQMLGMYKTEKKE